MARAEAFGAAPNGAALEYHDGESMRDQTIFLTGGLRQAAPRLAAPQEQLLQRPVPADVTDANALEAAMREADPRVVGHRAGIAGIDTVIKSPTRTMLVSLLGTVNACALKRLSTLHFRPEGGT